MRFGKKRKFDIIKVSLFPSPKPAKEAGFSYARTLCEINIFKILYLFLAGEN